MKQISNQSVGVALLLSSTVLLSGMVAHAQTTPRPGNAFEEGTQTKRLTDAEKQSLLEYAVNSKTRLERALQDGRGKALDEMLGIYRKAILQVVLESYSSKPRSELLMRHSLNQALQLTIGIPTPDGKGIQKPGVLTNLSNRDLTLRILEDSMKLAIKYYEDDRKAVQSGNLISLPYVSFATDRIALILKWHRSVFETDLQYDLLRTGLNQWYSTVTREDQQRQTLFAEEIVLADEDLSSTQDSTNGLTPAQMASNIRILRRDLRKISEGVDTKIRGEREAREAEERRREEARQAEERRVRETREGEERRVRETREGEERRVREAREAEERKAREAREEAARQAEERRTGTVGYIEDRLAAFEILKANENGLEDAKADLVLLEEIVRKDDAYRLKNLADQFVIIMTLLGGSNKTSETQTTLTLIIDSIKKLDSSDQNLEGVVRQFVRLADAENDKIDSVEGFKGVVEFSVSQRVRFVEAVDAYLKVFKVYGVNRTTEAVAGLGKIGALIKECRSIASYTTIVDAFVSIGNKEDGGNDTMQGLELVLVAAKKYGSLSRPLGDYVSALTQVGPDKTSDAIENFKFLYKL